MYLISKKPVEYTDPWTSSFAERFRSFARGDRRIAYYYEKPDTSTFRYRVYNMIQVLQEKRNGISASYFTQDELSAMGKVVDMADVLVICRSRYSVELNQIITRARNKGKKVFYDIDDLVFDTSYVQLILNTLDQHMNDSHVWDFWFADIGRLGMLLTLCDSAITTNEYLAAHIRDFAGKPVSVLPNFLNKEQMEISNYIYHDKKYRKFRRNGQVHLGYFSGTPTHNRDFDIVSDALVQLLEDNPGIVIRIVGFMDLKGPLQNYKSRFEFLPLCDFLNLQHLIGEVEINLVPLQDNEFTNCKSELKYFEAGIVGTASIASPVFTYVNTIRDDKNGVLAKSYEWYDKLVNLIRNIENLPAMGEKAYIDSRQKYAWYNQGELVESVLFETR